MKVMDTIYQFIVKKLLQRVTENLFYLFVDIKFVFIVLIKKINN